MKTIAELDAGRFNKQELFAETEGTFDYALPQSWLDQFANWAKIEAPEITYNLIRSTTVWSYKPNHGPTFMCVEVAAAYDVHLSQLLELNR